ncbi:DUF3499 family protein [uncultured Agrococcus sp.]|uniref:DUF3499 family protein n=1 Tax=uncultured Agrococcus sp. TaxID=382258 RepID=UPI0025F7A324|nr:DUF3499 family protein [uncultured Agrococcus sp.]
MGDRFCVKPTCRNYADFTLNYDYGERVIAIGPLLGAPAQGSYDLCSDHASKTTAPKGWQIVRSASSRSAPDTGR